MIPALFTPIRVGDMELAHRVVLAPLTRLRATPDGVPAPYAKDYYAQRATEGGLLISEATFIAHQASGQAGAPGIWSQAQIDGWRPIVDAVHAKGAKFFLQLWALGRVADPTIVKEVVSACDGTYEGKGYDGKSVPTPVRALSVPEIDEYVALYAQAAKNALAAGFDGVEIHGANGYLLDQFLQSHINTRTDDYGGSAENRCRFALRVLNAVAAVTGPERLGIRMSPFSEFQGMREEQPLETFVPWAKAIVAHQPKLAYVHAIEGRISGDSDGKKCGDNDDLGRIREVIHGAGIAFVVAGGFTPKSAIPHAEKYGDLVAFGRHFIPNPDLVDRLKHGWELTKYDRKSFYSPGEHGYTDWAMYEPRKATAA